MLLGNPPLIPRYPPGLRPAGNPAPYAIDPRGLGRALPAPPPPGARLAVAAPWVPPPPPGARLAVAAPWVPPPPPGARLAVAAPAAPPAAAPAGLVIDPRLIPILDSIHPTDYAFSQHSGQCLFDSFLFPLFFGKGLHRGQKKIIGHILTYALNDRPYNLDNNFKGVFTARIIISIIKKYEKDRLFSTWLGALSRYLTIGTKSILGNVSFACPNPQALRRAASEAIGEGLARVAPPAVQEKAPTYICGPFSPSLTVADYNRTRKYLMNFIQSYVSTIHPSLQLHVDTFSSLVNNPKSFSFQFITSSKVQTGDPRYYSIGHAVSITKTDDEKYYFFDNQIVARHLRGAFEISNEHINILKTKVDGNEPVFLYIDYNDPPGSTIYNCPTGQPWDECNRPERYPLFPSFVIFFGESWSFYYAINGRYVGSFDNSIPPNSINPGLIFGKIKTTLASKVKNNFDFNSKYCLRSNVTRENKIFPGQWLEPLEGVDNFKNIEYLIYVNIGINYSIQMGGGKRKKTKKTRKNTKRRSR